MPFAKLKSGLVFFTHVPRSGGSSVENYLHGRFGKLGFLDRGHNQRPLEADWNVTSPQHIDRETLERLLPADLFLARFAVVRHPVSRLQSVFLHNRDGSGDIPVDMTFEKWIADLPNLRREQSGYLDNHSLPINDFVPDDAQVFKLEDGMALVERWLDGLEGSTSSRSIKTVHSRDQVLAKRGKPVTPHVVTDAARALIEDLFAVDYARFGYGRSIRLHDKG
jgi:hypothetical protein